MYIESSRGVGITTIDGEGVISILDTTLRCCTYNITKKLVSAAAAALFVLVEAVDLVDVLDESDVAAAVVDADTEAGFEEVVEDAGFVAVPGTHWSEVDRSRLVLCQIMGVSLLTYNNMRSATGSTSPKHKH